MTNTESIGLGLITWNAERYLLELLESLSKQSFVDYKLYVLDNQSTDNTLTILENYARNDNRIEVHVDTKQRGFIEAQSLIFSEYLQGHEYCAFICDDDLYDEDFLSEHHKSLNTHKVDLSYSNFSYVTEYGAIVKEKKRRSVYSGFTTWNALKFSIYRNCIPIFFGVYKVQTLQKHMENFRRIDKFGYNHENLMLFSFMLDANIHFDPRILFFYRKKDRIEVYKQRGYPEVKNIFWQLKNDILHNFNFTKACFLIVHRTPSISSPELALFVLVLIVAYFRYTFGVYIIRVLRLFLRPYLSKV